MTEIQSGYASINGAQIYYEVKGEGQAFMMIHAGVADCRQWNNEFERFAGSFRAVRFDLRGYGKSGPVKGEYSHLSDLKSLLDFLEIPGPIVLMGCSMGGTLAMDYALEVPEGVAALIMVGSGPSGVRLDVPSHPKAEAAEEAYNSGDLDLTAELETQIWFDGIGRAPEDVDPDMRALAYDMNRLALSHDAQHLGTRLSDTDSPAADRMGLLGVPVLVVVGEHDIPFIQAASDLMQAKLPSSRKVVVPDAAHLPNMDQPQRFQATVAEFLEDALA